MRVVQHCNRVPRETVEPPSAETAKTQLDTALGSLLSLFLLEEGLGLPQLKKSLLNKPILQFHTLAWVMHSQWEHGWKSQDVTAEIMKSVSEESVFP